MALPSLSFIFRVLTKAGYTTKGSELTWLEHDGNWEILIDYILSIASTGNVAPYNSGQAYPFNDSNGSPIPTYVSYSGNVYLFVGTPYQTGVTPGSNPAIWQLVSTGALAHQQNTDQFLDLGGANEVSAAQLKTLLGSQVILLTRAAFNTLVSGSALRYGYQYFLTDKFILIHAIDGNSYDQLCLKLVSGIWKPTYYVASTDTEEYLSDQNMPRYDLASGRFKDSIVKVSLTAAQLRSGIAQLAIPAPGAGFANIVISAEVKMTFNSVIYDVGDNINLMCGAQLHFTGIGILSSPATIRAMFQNNYNWAENSAITIQADATSTVGDSPADFYIHYKIIKL